MNKKLLRIISALLAVLTVFSVMSVTAFAAEDDDTEDAAEAVTIDERIEKEIAPVGAELEEAQVGNAAPVITSAESGAEGVVLKWGAVSGVSKYRVDKYYNDGRGWQTLSATAGLTYTDTEVTSGNTYQYRLVGLNGAGNVITSTSTRTVTYNAPLRVTGLEVGDGGVRVYWNMTSQISKVVVYRMNSGSWNAITTTSDSSYFDRNVYSGSAYRYTVRGLNSSGAFITDEYDETGMSVQYLSTPSLKAENAAGGVKISWDKVEGAAAYRVFYRNSYGDWARLTTTTETSFLDEDVRSDRSYTYTVRCVSADGESYTSYFDRNGKTVKYIAAPVLLSADCVTDGIRITWAKSDGATQYRVFYKNSSGDWSRLGTTTSTSFLDREVSSGSSYTYTVRCMNGAGDYISYFYPEGIVGTYASAPDFNVSNGAEGVDIKWNAVAGAEKYRVYYYGSKGWTKLTDTEETSVTDTDVTSGYNYTYTVRCISADGKQFASGYLPGKKIKYYAAPGITNITSTTDGVKITWNKVPGTDKYRVYYYGRNGWTRMADVAGTTYLDEEVYSGETYTYTVRGINNEGTAFMGYFKPGVTHQYISAPDFSLTRNEHSITVSWDEVEGAELYRVYTLGENGWKRITDTTDTSYEDTSVVSGNTYSYTVRCLNADATEFTSSYREGKSAKFVETPYVSSVENTTEGVEIKWTGGDGATKYRVYYKTSDGWYNIGETAEKTFVHTAAQSGKTYTYTVRCINEDGTDYESDFDRTGKTIHYIASPKNIKVESEMNAIKISWTPSEGAEKYRVYYYGSRGWTRLTETTENTVIDDDVASGYTYRYTVRCITADGTQFTSDCDIPGVSYKFTYVPTLKTPDYTKDGIEISWNKSPGAEKYRVYYYGSKGWTKMAETTDTSYVDTDVESNTTYRYTVRCITADGTAFTSDCDINGVKIFYIAAPRLVSSDVDWSSLKFTWNKPVGATKYRVYKRVSGSWKRLTDTTDNSYTDEDIVTGSTYTYTVRVINNAGNQFYSGFDPDGFIIKAEVQDASVDGFVYYDQGAYNYPYGDDTIAYSGCGPTCLAMVASTLTGKSITPIDAVWCGNQYYVDNVGTRWDYFDAAAKRFGIKMEKQLGKSEINSVIAELKKGKYVISAQSAGRFTRGGHFIVLAGVTSAGKIIVYDPNGGNHYVGTAFDPSEITAAGTQYWVFSK